MQSLEDIRQSLGDILHMGPKSSLHSRRSIDRAEAFFTLSLCLGSKHARKHPKVGHILEAFGGLLDM